ncbi:MAG: hypothetical protein OEO20_06345 [Gemmatimonadota bacterium]|nr:hypothetical protein [Gemmatimonadota bacterium]MDH3477904.1 hypothetical protein [Gemmatimonadota bacterium]
MRIGATLLALAAWGAPLSAQTYLWRPEERVVLADFSYVDALAAGSDLVYAVTRGGIGVYDTRFRRWEPPVPLPSGYPSGSARTAIVDPTDRSLWIGTALGVTRYDPHLQSFDDVSVGGGVWDLMFDSGDPMRGLYVRSRFGWQLLQLGSLMPMDAGPLPPPGRQLRAGSVEAILERMPSLIARSTLALTDERLRRYRFTAAAELQYTREIFVGTDGYGVLRVDPTTLEIVRLPFGLPSDGVAAVEPTAGGVWVGSGARARRAWLAHVGKDLQQYDYEEGPPATGFRFDVVFDLVVKNDELWAATDRGLWRIVPGGQTRRMAVGVIGEAQRVYALAAGRTGIWAATERGLVFVDEREGDAMVADVSVREPLYAVRVLGDAIWVGGERGVGVLREGDETIRVPADVADEPILAGPVVALAVVGDTVVAALPDRIAWRDPGGRWTVERPLGEIGEISSLFAEAGGVWVAGTRGLAWFGFAGRAYRFLTVPGDLPGPIRRIGATGEYLWVGTDAGLVRLRKDVVVP